ncbi:hypothetical protein CMV_027555 [Castanea mollissima]|uniref:TIR domain-containing protein n=1 Tax=Castanea mollissima TaxID=60419 RepID=A0A8J4QI16_9ROSI|nr:hypothetical protein CMV_027555 [Castanea mollissima]
MALQINEGGSSSSTARYMYDVFLSFREVRKQKGKFGIALTEHEDKENKDKVQSWRAALTKAADLVGFSYEEGYVSITTFLPSCSIKH